VSDKIIKKHQAKGNVKPEHRLPLMLTLPGAIGLPIGVFVYGWTTFYKVHWIGESSPSRLPHPRTTN
jgi:hypothetical protein